MREKRPNLLFICSDQHSKFQTGCYGNPHVITPNLDRLAERGIRFDRAYSTNPICVPARAGMVTGRLSSEIGCWDNASPYTGQAPSFGHRLTEAGVEVTTIGKLHFRNAEDDTGFPDQRMPLHIRDGVGDVYGTLREPRASKHGIAKYIFEAGPGESSYTEYDRRITAGALEYLDERRNGAEPWMLYLGYTMPHIPLISPQEEWDLYEGRDLPLPVEYRAGDMPQHPVCQAHRRYMGLDRELDEKDIRRAVRTYYGMCTFLDRQIGLVLAKLEETGLADDTMILYATDHGEMLGNHGMWYKNCMYEPSVGIPLILAGPGVAGSRAVETTVSLLDIYPTVLDCMGVAPHPEDASLRGRPLLRLAAENPDPDRSAFAEYFSSACVTSGFMVRKGDYKYVYYVGFAPQLFDLKNDPMEMADLAADSRYAAVLADMDQALRAFGDPEAIDRRSRRDQDARLALYGGRDKVFEHFEPVIFSPAPK